MLKIFNWRSISIMVLGLVIGVALALAYRAASPINYKPRLGWPPIAEVAEPKPTSELYQSVVNIQMIAKASIPSNLVLKTLQRQGEYYTAKILSVPFLEWLNVRIQDEAPRYSHTAKEMAQMLEIKYDYKSQTPSVQLKVNSTDQEEAAFLADFIPHAFRSYILAENIEIDMAEYQLNLKELGKIRTSMAKAKKESTDLRLKLYTSNPTLSSSYVATEAKAIALQSKVNELAAKLAALFVQEPEAEQYNDTVARMGKATETLVKSRKELAAMKAQTNAKVADLNILNSEAKVNSLNLKVNELLTKLTALTIEPSEKEIYDETVAQLKRTSSSLVQSKKDLAASRALTETKMLDLNIPTAEIKVSALERRMNELSSKLVVLITEVPNQEEYDETVVQMNRTTEALNKARKELAALQTQADAIRLDPIATDGEARVNALERKVNELADRLVTFLIMDSGKGKYEEVASQLKKTTDALDQARKELADLKAQADAIVLDPNITKSETIVKTLDTQVNGLAAKLVAFAIGNPQGVTYDDIADQLNRAANALADSKKEQVAIKERVDVEAFELNLAYTEAIARDKILETQYEVLARNTTLWSSDRFEQADIVSYLVVQEPTLPFRVSPYKTTRKKAIMMGAVLGLGGAWLRLNFKTVKNQINSMISSSQATDSEESREEEKA